VPGGTPGTLGRTERRGALAARKGSGRDVPEGRSSVCGEVLCAETGSRAAHTRPTLGGVVGTWGRSRPSASSHPQPPPGVVLPGHSDRACGAEGRPWRAVRGVARYGGARQGEVKGRLGVQGTLRRRKKSHLAYP
jgi:hypothetical protein